MNNVIHHSESAVAPVANDWGSRRHVQTLVLMAATAFGVYLCGQLAAPFLPALAWALALAVLFTPLQRWLELKLKRANLAAIACVLVIGLNVLVPATFVSQRLVAQAANGARLIESKVSSGEWQRALKAQPRFAPLAEQIERNVDLPGAANSFANWLTGIARVIVNRLKLHTVLVFTSSVGGVILFGPAGLILGPIALTVTTVLLETWRSRATTVAREEVSELTSQNGIRTNLLAETH